MHDTTRFGIVGAGVIGPAHAEAIASLPESELIAIADSAPHQAATLATRYGAHAYTSLEEMLEREELDVVNVCTPSGMHAEHACQVMRAGRHVVVEKPMGTTRSAIDTMLRVQRDTGVRLGAIFQKRFEPDCQRIRHLIDEGAFGRLVLASAEIPWYRSQAYYDSGAWRGTWMLDGGGVLMNQAIHTIDLLLWFMGPVRSVTAYAETLTHSMEAEDVAGAIVRFESGAMATIAATTGALPGLSTRVQLCGDAGSAVLEDERVVFMWTAKDGAEVPATGLSGEDRRQVRAQYETQAPSAARLSTHALQLRDMIAAIREKRSPKVDGLEGRRAVDLILAMYDSARSGREVVLV